ncbi:MAG: hypothetical protein HY712_03920 [candidate division NC10 bacterium]|nr:hypothetical protein [candidate division NC10 bacterium]
MSPWWRTAAIALALALVVSWGYHGYRLLDMGISLTYCRAEQEHSQYDIEFLVRTGVDRLSSSDFLATQARLEPALPQRLEEGNTILLRTVTLRLGADSLLKGTVPR